MEKEKASPEDQHDFLSWERGKSRGKLVAGVLVVVFGLLYLFRELGLEIPRWLISWEIIMIGIGIVILIRHKFQKMTGYIFIAVGVTFKIHEFYPHLFNWRIIIPIIIIMAGISMIYRAKFGNRRKEKWKKMASKNEFFGMGETDVSPDDFIDAVTIFGSTKKQVVTKNFRGADMFTMFGGTELNLTQADFQSRAVVDLVTVFGGAEIIIPSDWTVQSEMVSVFGGLDDSRFQKSADEMSNKILILKGTCVFGGVEIKSYK